MYIRISHTTSIKMAKREYNICDHPLYDGCICSSGGACSCPIGFNVVYFVMAMFFTLESILYAVTLPLTFSDETMSVLCGSSWVNIFLLFWLNGMLSAVLFFSKDGFYWYTVTVIVVRVLLGIWSSILYWYLYVEIGVGDLTNCTSSDNFSLLMGTLLESFIVLVILVIFIAFIVISTCVVAKNNSEKISDDPVVVQRNSDKIKHLNASANNEQGSYGTVKVLIDNDSDNVHSSATSTASGTSSLPSAPVYEAKVVSLS